MATIVIEDIIIRREFDAPLKQIWEAWSDPKRLARWWGPKAFTAPTIITDFREGGRYLYCMRGPGPDGKTRNFWSTGVYEEIVPMKKIVCTDSFADEQGNVVSASYYGMPGDWPLGMVIEVTFEERNGRAVMTLRHSGIPGDMIESCRQGWNESFDKLAKSLK